MILTTLVTGATALDREAAIAAALDPTVRTAVILEGIPSGTSGLDAGIEAASLTVARVAPGCLCCTGNLTMRVTLNRMLRRQPSRLYLGVASTAHLNQVRTFLVRPPYDSLLQLTPDIAL